MTGMCGAWRFRSRMRRRSTATAPTSGWAALLLGEPDLFFTVPEYHGAPLVLLRLEQVDLPRLTELVTDAWRMRAPEALVAGYPDPGDTEKA